MRALAALCFAALTSACVFWSEKPLFDTEDAVALFADGGRFVWTEGGATQSVTYRLTAGARRYSVLPDDGERPIDVAFFPIAETPEDDYVAELYLPADEHVPVYAFMWAIDGGYRVVAAPRALNEQGQALRERLCSAGPYGECQLESQDALLSFYREGVYPSFVIGGQTPNDFIDQAPEHAP